MLNPDTTNHLDELVTAFQQAAPFRHAVIDNFFTEEFCARLLEAFPAFDTDHARNESGRTGRKAVNENLAGLGGPWAELDTLIRHQDFLQLISRLTGIDDLIYDPHYFGGGTHENLEGQELDPHIDFNYHPITRDHRRLNLIVYLNRDWQPEWGGSLELHSNPRSPADEIVPIVPVFNRAVIFETTEFSWHGFPRISLPKGKESITRKSVALYYYTNERPRAETGSEHSTVYVERPLPGDIRPGSTLSDNDHATILTLLARRDQHIERLYSEVQRLTEQNTHLSGVLRRIEKVLFPLFWLRRRFRKK